MPFIKFKNTDVYYDVSGEGPVLVWLHGFLESSRIWKSQTDFFNANYTNICIDLLGHGESGIVDKTHFPILQAEVVFEVLKSLKINSCSIIGHSMGGYVALAFAEKFPLFLSSLVLLNSTSYADTEEKKLLRKRALRIVDEQKETYARLGVINLFSENSRKVLHKEIDQVVEIAKKTSVHGIKAALMGMMQRPSRFNILRNFTGKKIIISGTEDVIIPVKKSKKEAEGAGSLFLELQGGHMSYIEDFKNLNKLIDYFLTKN